ncbi:hypothetical protein [Hansschlegelia zhihuaiae]|uniref:Uncharacterized protein n=1 Tax=Hansschlegelia zhihuaiae TaxID=405005 RepID=A0A4Q0MNN8_9HYPH|nr:hypothetical protein [Hansschlegelia zhihuaiae]RXF74656.1 hypothetical protein EK403_04485 [Hansschlegelia zhihuaiae]
MLATPVVAVERTNATIKGQKAVVFKWRDSAGRFRSVALKREGAGNSGHGGYAIRMTYNYLDSTGAKRTVTADAPKDDGFGYFVSHERYRKFTDGESNTIAGKIFGKDDSPLGRGFAVTGRVGADGKKFKSYRFKTVYPRYGAKAPGGIDDNTGDDQPPLGLSQSLFQLYELPVTITWSFQDGRDHPRIQTVVDLSRIPGPDLVSFDLRGPYGKLDFNAGSGAITRVVWGDAAYHFTTTSPTLTRNSTWTWNAANDESRYTALIAGQFEMGLFEPQPVAGTKINDGFAFGRGQTDATHDAAGAGCGGQALPCDWEWPYQSAQYELPYDNPNGVTTSEKIAWGSTAYYGMSLGSTYDGTRSVPFNGFPTNRKLSYSVCVVLGQTVAGSLTRFDASGGGDYNCARVD